MLALGLWPLASLVLTLPVLAILYRRDGRLRFWSALGAYLSVLYLLALMCFTLYPLPSGNTGLGITYGVAPQLDFWVFIDDIRRDGKVAVLQLLANVAFFVPLGIIVGRGLRKGFGWALVLGFLVSLFVETAQLTGLFLDLSLCLSHLRCGRSGMQHTRVRHRVVPGSRDQSADARAMRRRVRLDR